MWIWRSHYDTLLSELVALREIVARVKAENTGAERHIGWLETQLARVELNLKMERQRAEMAVDRMLRLKVDVSPISPENPENQRFDPAQLDTLFEEEDQDAVQKMRERIATEGLGPVYAEAIEELYGHE